uniref:Uncharacterized protein n=1 Tax=Oryza brachyantha TaxID=4533 RepID=J3MVV2_ORYBR
MTQDSINAYLEPKCNRLIHKLCRDQYILPKIAERELRRFSYLRSASSAVGIKPLLSEIPVPWLSIYICKAEKFMGKNVMRFDGEI